MKRPETARCRWWAASLAGAVALSAFAWPGCGGGWQLTPWLEVDKLNVPTQQDYPRADGVYLIYEKEMFQYLGARQPSHRIDTVHAAIVVLNESGRRFSEVGVRYRENEEISNMSARSIAPDGTITPLEPERIYEDEPEQEEGDSKVRVFVLPKVQVGTIIEYRYAVKAEGLYTVFYADLWRDQPARHVRVVFRIHERGKWRAAAYQTDTPLKLIDEGTYATIAWEDRNLPAVVEEPFSPPKLDIVPRAYAVITRYDYVGKASFHVTWNNTVNSYFFKKMVLDRAFAARFALPGALAALRSVPVPERIAKAYEFVRIIPYVGEEEFEPRPFATILKERSADDYEKALLLHHILDQVGVKATLALIRPRHHGELDPEFPRHGALTSAIVYVPEQAGVSQAQWLQPWCSHCRAGQVSWDVAGIQALLLGRSKRAIRSDFPDTEFLKVEAPTEPLSRTVRTREVRLRPDGRVEVRESLEYAGRKAAVERRERALKTDKELEDAFEEELRKDVPAARLTDFRYLAAELEGAPVTVRCSWEAPGLATRMPDGMVVRLGEVGLGFKETFEKQRGRVNPYHFARPRELKLVTRFLPPPGYRFGTLPAGGEAKTEFAEYQVRWEADGNRRVQTVTLRLRNGQWPASQEDAFRKLFRGYRKAGNVVLMLEKKPLEQAP